MNLDRILSDLTSLDVQIGNPNFIWLMVFALVAMIILVWSGRWRKKAIQRFGAVEQFATGESAGRRFFSSLMLLLSIVFLSLALMDIRWGKTEFEVPQKGIEVVFALDVSRSMLAEDASPNRLRRAKQQIKDMVDEMAGDRVGLIVFAGEADQAVPLTSHYDDFKQVLDSVGPHSVPVGGSQLSFAIESAAKAFIGKTNDHKTIALLTDGEDQESDPVRLARELHEQQGVRVFTIGLGDMDQGARIPNAQSRSQSYVQHQGQQVWSKLNGRILREIATESEAAYIPAGTKRVNMADVYHRYIANVEQTEFETAKINAWVPRFQWFAAAAFFCLCIEVLLSSKGSKRRGLVNRSSQQSRSSEGVSKKAVAAAVLFGLLVPVDVTAQDSISTARKINEANGLVRDQKTTEAIEAFANIDSEDDGEIQSLISYNNAVAHFRNSDYPAAMTLFADSAKSNDSEVAANSRYNLGNCRYATALSLAGQNPDEAIEQLRQAIAQYRSSLRLDRSNADARANIELARKLIEQLQEKSEEQKQEQQEDQQQQDSGSSDESDKEQESKSAEQNEQSDKRDSDSEESRSKEQQGESQENQSQKQEGKEDGSNSEQSDTNPSEGNESQVANENGDSRENEAGNRQQDTGSESEQDAEKAKGAQQKDGSAEEPKDPSGELTAANEADEKSDQNAPKANQSAIAPSDERDGMMTREEALKLLQAVRDRDMLRRLQQQRRQGARRVPVEKDW